MQSQEIKIDELKIDEVKMLQNFQIEELEQRLEFSVAEEDIDVEVSVKAHW